MSIFVADGQEVIIPPDTLEKLPADIKAELIRQTADSIADLQAIDELSPIIISSGIPTSERIAHRRQALADIGADADEEIKSALQRFHSLTQSDQAKRCVRYMMP